MEGETNLNLHPSLGENTLRNKIQSNFNSIGGESVVPNFGGNDHQKSEED
jgi:hypothetical protein